jgi:hypothetical protein
MLVHPYPQLGKLDKAARADAIWLFEHGDVINAWLATLTQSERDRWTHPRSLRRQYQKRHLVAADKPRKPRFTRHVHQPVLRSLANLTREELEAHILRLEEQVGDRDREIIDLRSTTAQRGRGNGVAASSQNRDSNAVAASPATELAADLNY